MEMIDSMVAQDIDADSMPMTMYRLGEIDSEMEREIAILKAATLLRELYSSEGDTYRFSYGALTYQVAKLNDQTDRATGRFPGTRMGPT